MPLSGSETSWWKELCVPCARIFPICAFCAGAEYLPRFFPPCSVERIFLNFSTPFPKPSNENRRLTYPPFCKIYLSILKEGGTVELKTDDADFFEYSANSLLSVGFCVTERSTDFCSEDNIETEHEKMYRSEGKKILRLVAVKKGADYDAA